MGSSSWRQQSNLSRIAEYLGTSYQPNRDFADGTLEERNAGERPHNRLQLLLGAWFLAHEHEWNIYVLPEQRTRVSNSRVRVPDISVLRAGAPREDVTQTPPLLCIEILSPEDRLAGVVKRMDDYLNMNIEHLWIVDPVEKLAWTYSKAGLLKVTEERLTVPGTPIYADLQTLFVSLN